MSKQVSYLTDSDDEMGEREFLEHAGFKNTGSPEELTHGIVINFQKDLRLKLKASKSLEYVPEVTEVKEFEIDAFRFKVKQDQSYIQIVENKSFSKGGPDTPEACENWLNEHLVKKVNDFCNLKHAIPQYSQDAVVIYIQNPVTKVKEEVTGVEKLRFLKMFVACNSIKFRFSGTLSSSFETKLNEKIASLGQSSGLRLTYQHNKADAESDPIHYKARALYYKDKLKDLKESKKDQPIDPSLCSSVPTMALLMKKLNKLQAKIDKLEQNQYSSKFPTAQLFIHSWNGCSRINRLLSLYNSGEGKKREKVKKSLVSEAAKLIGRIIEPLGYTAEFKCTLVFNNEKEEILLGIQVVTKPSKYLLIYQYELKLAKIYRELNQELNELAKKSLSVPTPLVAPRRSSFSKPTSLALSRSPSGIFSSSAASSAPCSTEQNSKPVVVPPKEEIAVLS